MAAQTLTPQVKLRVKQLLELPLEDPAVLLHEINSHARVVEIVAKRKRPQQLPLSRALAKGLIQLLEGVNESSPTQHRKVVQAACRYFCQNQPGDDHDLASDSGLDDDAAVFQLVAGKLGRNDLVEEIAALLKTTSV